jgi:hypothetical protein
MKLKPRNLLGFTLCTILAVASLQQVQAQGKLDAFEADVTARPSHSKHAHRSRTCISEFFGEIFAEVFAITLFYGGAMSWQRVSDIETADPDIVPRAAGDPLIPFSRFDVAYQNVHSDIEAVDIRGEVGYGPFGLHADFTRYWEAIPTEDLDLIRILGLYRMSFGSHLETDLGFGVLTLRGEETTSRFLFSVPVLVHPDEYWGIEFRPAWTERVSDYDIAVMLNRDYTSVKFGYRWINSPNESLHGPYIGISVRL